MSFMIDISEVLPSQLYISRDKLESVSKWIEAETHNYDCVPIKRYGDLIVLTDGHTRAVKLFLSGVKEIKVYWDEEDLDDSLYSQCINWCIEENIRTVEDLSTRIIDKESYEKNWIGRCAMYGEA
jgi:hypothetical protein